MASLDSVRIALKPMSRMSLNERFQRLRQKQMQQQNNASAKSTKLADLRQGSQKNRRLALQMANRPSVLAALRPNQNTPKNQSIKQRLGVKRFANKSMPVNRNQNRPGFGPNSKFNANRNVNIRNNAVVQNIYRRKTYNPNTQNIGVIVGVRRKGIQRNKFRPNFKPTANTIGVKGKRKVGQQIRNQNQAKGVMRKGFRINRNFNARNNPGKPVKRRNVRPNREQLDKDLDAYMAGTKSCLDAELDAYMSQTN